MSQSASAASLPPWVPTDLYPFATRRIEVDGHDLHYVDEGSGPTLLLMHGNPTWSFLYRGIILALRDRFRCVALDYPGFGLSTAAAGYDFLPVSHARVVQAFVERLELSDYAVMVQDWGGPIGLWVAGQAPERVRALVIGNTWAWPVNGNKHFERFSGLMGGRLGRVAITRLNAFVNLMIPTGVRRKRLPRKVMTAYRRPFPTRESRLPTYLFPREIIGSRSFLAEVEAGLAGLSSKPALITWGDRDVAFRAPERERFERTFPEHRTVMLQGAGHYIQEDAGEEIARAIADWWGDVVAPVV